jgi:hypothetical protein
VGTTISLFLVGFYCESTYVLTLQKIINKHITHLENVQGKIIIIIIINLQVLC